MTQLLAIDFGNPNTLNTINGLMQISRMGEDDEPTNRVEVKPKVVIESPSATTPPVTDPAWSCSMSIPVGQNPANYECIIESKDRMTDAEVYQGLGFMGLMVFSIFIWIYLDSKKPRGGRK